MDNILTENLSEELQTNEGLSKFSDVNSLAKSYLDLEIKFTTSEQEHKEALSKAVQVPGEDADEETRRSFYQKLGCPEKPEKYSNIEIKGLSEGFEQDSEVVTSIQTACHKVGISDTQYKTVMEQIAKEQLISLDTFVKRDKAAEEEAVKTLTQDWGGEAKYKEKIELGRRLIKHYDSEDSKVSEFLIDTRLGSYAPLVRLLGNVAADIIGEETTFTGETSGEKKEGQVERSKTTGEPMLVYDKSPELME